MWGTAAPVYFPIEKGYIDGGVFANNPSLCDTPAGEALFKRIPQGFHREHSKKRSFSGKGGVVYLIAGPLRLDVFFSWT